MIENLILSGGSIYGLTMFSILKTLTENNIINTEEIKKIYCVSVGLFNAILISLKIDLDTIKDYLLKRPWNKALKFNFKDTLNIINNKGLIDGEYLFKIFFNHLLSLQNLSEDITLLEFYNFNKKEIHIFTTKINTQNLEYVDLSYKTHPNLKLSQALAMTAGLPIIFTPIIYDNCYYTDGGILCNYPLFKFLENLNLESDYDKCIVDKTLGICIKNKLENKLSINSNLFEYILKLYELTKETIEDNNIKNLKDLNKIKNQIIVYRKKTNPYKTWYESIFSEEIREELFNDGIEYANQFITDFKNSIKDSDEGLAS